MEPFNPTVLGTSLSTRWLDADVDVPARRVHRDNTQPEFLMGETLDLPQPFVRIADAQASFLLRGGGSELLIAFNPRDLAGDTIVARIARSDLGSDPPRGASSSYPTHVRHAVNMYVMRRNVLEVGVVLSSAPGDSMQIVRMESRSLDPIRVGVPTARDSAIVSLEVQEVDSAGAARHRFAVFRPGREATSRVKMSDIVLYDGSGGVRPTSNRTLLPLMLPRSTIDRSEQIGIYWELYGPRPGDAPEFELRATPTDTSAGFFLPVAQSVGLAARPGTVLTRWKERAIEAADIGAFSETPHSIIVNMASLRPGVYQVAISSIVPGDSAVLVSKLIRVR